MIKLLKGDCREVLGTFSDTDTKDWVIVTDPPFNIGYRYGSYRDRMPDGEYYGMLARIIGLCPSVIVHYPESLYRLSAVSGAVPERVVSWVYNSNTRRQHRDIAFFGVTPDFSRVKQPYKNPNDRRVKRLIQEGHTGASLYD